jgi:hypothetical protein
MKRAPSTRPRQATANEQLQPPAPVDPPDDAIAARAYELYLARGGADGRDLDDWLQAEQELRGQGPSD